MTPEQIAQLVKDEVNTIQKAVTATTYTMDPTSRSIYSPENLDPVIKLLVPVGAPVRQVLPRVSGLGEAATWNKITSRLDNQAGGTGTSMGFADAGQPNQTTQTTVFTAAKYKNLGRDVEIGRQAIAANRGRNIEDIRASQETIKTYEVILGEEAMLLNGSATANTLEFDGLAKSITNSGTASLLTASGVGTHAKTLFDNGSEAPTHLITSSRQNVAIADDLRGNGNAIERVTISDQSGATVGAHVAKIVNPVTGNLIDVITSRYAGTWGYLLTVTSPAGENWIEVEDLESLSVYDVPTSNHSVQSRVFETSVLKVIGDVYQIKIGGLAT